jgi:hypothetical protein
MDSSRLLILTSASRRRESPEICLRGFRIDVIHKDCNAIVFRWFRG